MAKKSDFLLISVLLIIAVTFICLRLTHHEPVTAVIVCNGETVDTVELDKVTSPYTLTLDGEVHAVIAVENGRIRYQDADCPDKICVNSGWLSKAGDAAVCLPGRSYIMLKSSDNSSSFDAVTG